MITDQAQQTDNYLQGVLHTGRQLQSLLNEDYETLDWAARQLKQAAQQYNSEETNFRNFMFSALDKKSEWVEQQRSVEKILTNVLTDLKVGNVLIAAGQTLNQKQTERNPEYLDNYLKELEASIQYIPETNNQKETNQALKTFEDQVQETLQILVDNGKEAVTSIFDKLSELEPNTLLSALESLGTRLPVLPEKENLLGQGIQIIQGAIKSLDRLVGQVGKKILTPIKDKVEQTITKLKEGNWVEEVLERAFGCKSVREELNQILSSECLDLSKFDAASFELTALTQTYKEKMKIIQGIVWTIPTASFLLSLIPTVQLQGVLPLFAASAYVLLLAVVIIIGMDYTDSEQAIGLVRGVGEVVRSLDN